MAHQNPQGFRSLQRRVWRQPAPGGEVLAPAEEVPAPAGEVPARVREIPAPAEEVPAPTGDFPAPTGEVSTPAAEGAFAVGAAQSRILSPVPLVLFDMAGDWYPRAEDELDTWLETFSIECENYKGTFPSVLTAGNLLKIVANATFAGNVLAASDLARNYFADLVAYKAIWLNGDLGTPVPAVPVPPAGLTVPANTVVGIEDFTRSIAAQIKASPAYTAAIGAAMGIVGSDTSFGAPEVISLNALGVSQVRLALKKAGYPALAVDSKRGTGDWEQIGISLTAAFTDSRGPLATGVSEVREYRVQGVLDNIRQGPISGVKQIATTP